MDDRHVVTLYCMEHIHAARPTLQAALFVAGSIGVAAIGGGIVAIVWGAVSPTQFDFLGLSLTTSHVGVALVGLGLASTILITRRLMLALERLGALPASDDVRLVAIRHLLGDDPERWDEVMRVVLRDKDDARSEGAKRPETTSK